MNLKTITLTVAAAAALTGVGALLDGPSDHETALAQQQDLTDAQRQAARFDRDLRRCKLLVGPTADLIEIQDTGDFVCRAVPVKPLTQADMQGYARLAGGAK